MKKKFNPEEEAQKILEDILEERSPEELHTMSIKDAIETVEAYGHKGDQCQTIAQILHNLAEGI
jgi:hypothetical protein